MRALWLAIDGVNQCGSTFCDSRANLYNAAKMVGKIQKKNNGNGKNK